MSPPYVVTESELERMVGILRTAIQAVVSEVEESQQGNINGTQAKMSSE